MAKRHKNNLQSYLKKPLLLGIIALAVMGGFWLSFVSITTKNTTSSQAASLTTKYVAGQLIFKVRSGYKPSTSTVRKLTGYSDAKVTKLYKDIYLLKSKKLLNHYKSISTSTRSVTTATSPDKYTSTTISKLKANSNFIVVKTDPVVTLDMVPNDEYYVNQKPYLDKMGVEAAWDKASNGQEIIIATIDSGIAPTHADITNNMWVNQSEYQGRSGVDDDNNGYKDDIYGFQQEGVSSADGIGHGTHVAGIIAATANNGKDIAGMCPTCKIMSIKSADGSNQMSLSNIIAGMGYAITQKSRGVNIRTINHSYGIQKTNIDTEMLSLTRQMFVDSKNAGIISVASAGNRGESVAQYPALFTEEDLVFTVAAVNRHDVKASFSSYGAKDSQIDFAAPGTDQIRGAYVEGIISLSRSGGSIRYEGTSMAAPHVTGLIGMMLSLKPDLTYAQAKTILTATADNIDDAQQDSYKGQLGFGRINADRAMTKLIADYNIPVAPTNTPIPPTSTPEQPTSTPIPPTSTPVPPPSGVITSGVWSYTLTCLNGKFTYNQNSNGQYKGSYCVDITVNGAPSFGGGCGWGGATSGGGVTGPGYFYKVGSSYTMRAKIWNSTRTTLLVDESITRRCGS